MYGRFAHQVRSKENEYNSQLNRYQNQLTENSRLQTEKENEYPIKIQQAKDEYQQSRIKLENEYDKKIKEKEEVWNQQIKTQEEKFQQEIDEKEAILKRQGVYTQRFVPIESHPEEKENELQHTVYNPPSAHLYQPSLSNGIYGHYALIQMHNSASSDPTKARASLTAKDPLYDKIYAATKEVDDKYRLIFKAECNVKGCCNKPEIDGKLLKGDMYICRQHRLEMANKIKQSGLTGDAAKEIIDKLTNGNESELLAQGQQMVDNDYFVKSYTKLKIRQKEIVKELLTLKRSKSKYWALKIEYKQIQKSMEFLLLIRKISNPFLLSVIIVAIFGGCSDEDEEYEEFNTERIQELSNLMDNLSSQIRDKERMKNECLQLIKDAEKAYDDKVTDLKGKIAGLQKLDDQKWNAANTAIDNAKAKHKAIEAATEQSWNDNIKGKQDEINQERQDEEKKWDDWIQQKVNYQEEVDRINNEMREAVRNIKAEQDRDNKEMDQLEQDLEDETLDEVAWEKKMNRLEKLENKRAKNKEDLEKINKKFEDKLDDVKKDTDNDAPDVDINQLKRMKEWQLQTMKSLRDKELQTLKTNKDKAMDQLRIDHENVIKGLETDRDNERKRLQGERDKIQKQLDKHQDEGWRALENFKRRKKAEAEKLQREEDQLNWKQAKNRAEYLCRNTDDDRIAVYVVYDNRKWFGSGYSNAYSASRVETYSRYGNYSICKFEADYKRNEWTKFKFKASGRSHYWYHYINNSKSIGSDGGYTVVKL